MKSVQKAPGACEVRARRVCVVDGRVLSIRCVFMVLGAVSEMNCELD